MSDCSNDIVPPVFHVRIATLNSIQVPLNLNGQNGHYRLPRDKCRIEADTDLEAVKLWLAQYDADLATFRAYRHVVELLINWTLIEGQKPLSSLGEDDFSAFDDFLSDPQPSWQWLSPQGTSRSSCNWTPLVRPLSPKSRLNTHVVLRIMFDWLRKVHYCDVGISLSQHSIRAPLEPSALVLSTAHDRTSKFIRMDDWNLVRRRLGLMRDKSVGLDARLAVELMYYGGLMVNEVAAICVEDFVKSDGVLQLHIRSRPPQLSMIYLVPPLAHTVENTLDLVRGNIPASCDAESNVGSMDVPKNLLISRRDVGRLVKNTFNEVAHIAFSDGESATIARLRTLPAHYLSNAFEAHASNVGASTWVWLLIGARRLLPSATRAYLPRREKLGELELEEAFCALAPCWSDVAFRQAPTLIGPSGH